MDGPTRPQSLASVRLGEATFQVEVLDLRAKGQDRHLVRDGFAGVADGASPVKPGRIDVGEFAGSALEVVATRVSEGASLRAAVRDAILRVGASEADAAATPAAALVAMRAHRGTLEFGVLCDSGAIVRLRNGRIRRTKRDQVLARKWDGVSDRRMGERVLAGDDLATARRSIEEHLVAQRYEKNRPGGYWVLADEPAAADHLLSMRIPLDQVESVILGSDGFFRLIDLFGIGAALLFAIAEQGHLQLLGTMLRALEVGGPFSVFPRVSVHDDTTAILLTRLGEAVREQAA